MKRTRNVRELITVSEVREQWKRGTVVDATHRPHRFSEHVFYFFCSV